METNNNNTSAPQAGAAKKHNHKRKYHKPKAYFITPGEGESKSEKVEKSDVTQKQESGQQRNKNHTGTRPHHRHHNKAENKADTKATMPAEQKLQAPKQETAPSQNTSSSKNKKKHRRNRDKQSIKGDASLAQPTAVQNETNTNVDFTPVDFSSIPAMPSKTDRLEKPTPKKLEKFSSTPEYEKYSDYEEYTFDELYGEEKQETALKVSDEAFAEQADNETKISVDDSNEPLVDVVGIKFKETGKVYYFDPGDIKLKIGMHAIVKTARGLEYGDVALSNTKVKESETVPPLRSVARIATEADIAHHIENKKKEDEAFRICNEKIIAHKLDMKLIDAQYTFDNSKLLFYFTSSGRVDFRDLVKDLAAVFRTRIELRQVGIRDEAKMVGGFGPCGRALCCSLFLTDFGQVSIKMAKEQNLSLNSAKISGICGRLMCCLRYEYDTYEYEIKRTPPVDSLVRTVDGVGTVTEISPLAGVIKVRLAASPEIPPKSYKREDVTILKKKQ